MIKLFLAALAGCAAPIPEDVAASVSDEIGTVVTVRWTTPEPASSWVEYGPTEALGLSSPVSVGSSHTQALLGLTADTAWYFRVVAEAGDRRAEGETHEVRTHALPAGLPDLETAVEPGVARQWGAYTLFTWFHTDDNRSVVLIVDRDGAVVWYHQVEGQCLSAAFSRDRAAVVMIVTAPDGLAYIERVPLDATPTTVIEAPRAHHDFVELDEGYAYIAGEERDIDSVRVVGDRIVEVDAAGERREVWTAFDHLPVEENEGWSQEPADWTHANGLAYDPDTNRYLLSLFRQEQVVAVDAATGETAWTLGAGGDFAFVDDPGFGPQHAPEVVGGDVLVFDNAYDAEVSRLVAYTLDVEAGTARRAWSLDSPVGERSFVMGDGDRLPGGGAVSSWGERSVVVTTTPDGEVARTVTVAEAGGVIGHVDRTDTLYPR